MCRSSCTSRLAPGGNYHSWLPIVTKPSYALQENLQEICKKFARHPRDLPLYFYVVITAILRTFFERKGLANEATNWLNGLSNSTSTGERPMTMVNDILKQMPALGQP